MSTMHIMTRLLPVALLLAGCVTDRTLSPGERHRAWVCLHTSEVRFAATTARLVAQKIRNPNARAAALAAADAELAIVEGCR